MMVLGRGGTRGRAGGAAVGPRSTPSACLSAGRWGSLPKSGSWEELAVSGNCPRHVRVTDAMLGAQHMSLRDSVCLVVEATGVDEMTCRFQVPDRVTFQDSGRGGEWSFS